MIPRCYNFKNLNEYILELLIFSDSRQECNNIHLTLVMFRTQESKVTTIARLALHATVMGCRLAKRYKKNSVYLFDILKSSIRLPTFDQNIENLKHL